MMVANVQRIGAFSFIGMAVCYLVMFIIYGVILSFPESNDIAEKIAYIIENSGVINLSYGVGYLLFGCLLLISVQVVHNCLNIKCSLLVNSASLFGFIWVVLMMASGMIGMVGLHTVSHLQQSSTDYTVSLFYAYTTVVNGLGGGIECVGALWVLLLSVVSLRTSLFSLPLSCFGILVGIIGLMTLFQQLEIFKTLFGLSQIVWFIWMALKINRLIHE